MNTGSESCFRDQRKDKPVRLGEQAAKAFSIEYLGFLSAIVGIYTVGGGNNKSTQPDC